MSTGEWVALITLGVTVVGAVAGLVRFLVKHYLDELKPNTGRSLKDQVSRLETRVDEIYRILLNRTLS
jgi:hypothetical protein